MKRMIELAVGGVLVVTVLFMLAPVGCTVEVVDANAGGNGGDDEQTADTGGDNAVPTGGGDTDTSAATAAACSFMTTAQIEQVRDAVEQDMDNGISKADELAAVMESCSSPDVTVSTTECTTCVTAIINEVYP